MSPRVIGKVGSWNRRWARTDGSVPAISPSATPEGRSLFPRPSEECDCHARGDEQSIPEDFEAELRKDRSVRDCVVLGLDMKGDGNAEPCACCSCASQLATRTPRPKRLCAPRINLSRHTSKFADGSFGTIRIFHERRRKSRLLAQIRRRSSTRRVRPAKHRSRLQALWRISFRTNHSSRPASFPAARDLSADLNLSSVDRVELMSALEDRYQVDLSEARFAEAKTVGDVERLLAAPPASSPATEFVYPRWADALAVPVACASSSITRSSGPRR